jgi:hypothetical protein
MKGRDTRLLQDCWVTAIFSTQAGTPTASARGLRGCGTSDEKEKVRIERQKNDELAAVLKRWAAESEIGEPQHFCGLS